MYAPQTLAEYIGQDKALKQIAVAIKAAVKQHKPLPHILLSGFGGTGKTTLSKIIASTMQQRLVLRMPSTLKESKDVWDLFNDEMVDESTLVYFVDEIHRLDSKVQEEFYLPMENGIIVRKHGRPNLRGTYDLKPFTMIGATTNPGRLTEPFRSRFGLIIQMEPYNLKEMQTIISQAASQSGIKVNSEALISIASRSRASPRIANHLLDRCRDVMYSTGVKEITPAVADECFEMMGIDDNALNEQDRQYLFALYNAMRPIGPNSLEPILHIDKESIVKSVEPYLVESGWVSLTSRGRELTKKGMDFVEITMGKRPHGLTRVV